MSPAFNFTGEEDKSIEQRLTELEAAVFCGCECHKPDGDWYKLEHQHKFTVVVEYKTQWEGQEEPWMEGLEATKVMCECGEVKEL